MIAKSLAGVLHCIAHRALWRNVATWATAFVAVTSSSVLRAHHSISVIDTSTPVWVKGTVVRYEIVNPHTMVEIEEKLGDGQVKRWTVEGPGLGRIERMGVDESFLKLGDVIEVCGFNPKKELLDRRPADAGPLPPFTHGHMIVMPDGRMSPWGPYGKLENCVRPGDQAQSWLNFLNTNKIARDLWCNPYRTTVPTIAVSRGLVQEINDSMASPCG